MKIVASDYDGTLFQENGIGISEEDKNAICKFRTQGGLFGMVTGRDLYASVPIKKELSGMLDFLICSTGAVACDGEGRILFQHKSSETKAVSDIADFSLKHNVASFTVINELTRHHLDIFGKIPHNFSSLKEFNNCTLWFKTIEDAENVEAYVKESYEDKLTFFRNFECIEITPLGVTKAVAVKEYTSQFDNPSVYTIGDGVTDIPMILEFCGFAINNANEKVKKVAKNSCDRVCDLIEYALNN